MTTTPIFLSETSDEGLSKLENLLTARDSLMTRIGNLYDSLEEVQQEIMNLDREIDRVILEDQRSSGTSGKQ